MTCFQVLGKLVHCCSYVLNLACDTEAKAEGQRYCKVITDQVDNFLSVRRICLILTK